MFIRDRDLFAAPCPRKKKQQLALEDDSEVHSTSKIAGLLQRHVAKKAANFARMTNVHKNGMGENFKRTDAKADDADVRIFEKPSYFESQVGAMCGLHAVNNICGSHTGSQTFTVQDVADGLCTLEQEYKRDGLAWDIRDHARLSGDYSLALLSWMLQRRLVSKPSAQQFIAGNLRNSCTAEELMAEDLAGVLVHIPLQNNPLEDHWIAIAKHKHWPLNTSTSPRD